MRKWTWAAAVAAAMLGSTPASADTICEWYEFGQSILLAPSPSAMAGGPRNPDLDRAGTRLTIAMFEAVNAIDRRYQSYLGLPARDAGASQEAAAITAAYRILHEYFPAQRTSLDDAYALAMNGITDAARRQAGQQIGEEAARAAMAAGGVDAAIAQVPYRPRTEPGVWTATSCPCSIRFR